jgi:hypothetical protein
VLYPQNQLKIEPLTLSVDVQLPQTVDMFGRWCLLKQQRKFRLEPKPSTLNHCQRLVNQKIFRAVGSFDFKVTPSKTTLKHDESLDLVVSVCEKET